MLSYRINIRSVGVYLLFLFIAYLAGVYLGGLLLFLFLFFLFLPVATFIHLLITYIGLRFRQDFSTDHPVKGEEVIYTISVALESALPGTHGRIRFKRLGREFRGSLEDIEFLPAPRHTFTKSYPIQCPFRGIYTVGMEAIELSDLLRWCSMSVPVWHRTFYVFPRLIHLHRLALDASGDLSPHSGTETGNIQDYTICRTLTEYRTPQSVRHIAWKRFAATGYPSLKVYERTSWPGITIYLDTRRSRPVDYRLLESEDCSIEIVVALIHYLVKAGIPVYLRTGQRGIARFEPGEVDQVYAFIESTVNLYFSSEGSPAVSPLRLLHMDLEARMLYTGHILLVTHLFDSDTVSFFTDAVPPGMKCSGIFNVTGMESGERNRVGLFAESCNEEVKRMFVVSNPETIAEELS